MIFRGNLVLAHQILILELHELAKGLLHCELIRSYVLKHDLVYLDDSTKFVFPNINRNTFYIFKCYQDESNSKERLGPINVVIRILQILQLEHVFLTLENIKECYDACAELNSRNNISIANALQWACDHKKVTIERTRVPSHGNLSLYRLADSHLGICSNPRVGTNIDYIEVWPQLQTLLLDNIGGGNRLEPGKSMFEFAGILRRKFFNVCNFGERFLIGEILTVIHVMLKPKLNGGLDWMGNRPEQWAPNFKMRNIRRYKEEDIVGIASRP